MWTGSGVGRSRSAACLILLGLVLVGCSNAGFPRLTSTALSPSRSGSHFSSAVDPDWRSGQLCDAALAHTTPGLTLFLTSGAAAGTRFVLRPLSHRAGHLAPAPVALTVSSANRTYTYVFHDLGSPAEVEVNVTGLHDPAESFNLNLDPSATATGRACSRPAATHAVG
jgi:hypothetical protein